MWQGSVVSIQIAPQAAAPMVSLTDVEAVAGKGLAGDRYFQRAGTHSDRAGSGRQVTLIEVETMEALAREGGLVLEPALTRRNIATRDVPLSHLVGRRFRIGDAVLEGTRLCEPCEHLQRLTRPGVLRALVHRGGLRADILVGGVIRVGDVVRPERAEPA